jgi:hypothetical protein
MLVPVMTTTSAPRRRSAHPARRIDQPAASTQLTSKSAHLRSPIAASG